MVRDREFSPSNEEACWVEDSMRPIKWAKATHFSNVAASLSMYWQPESGQPLSLSLSG